MSDVDPPTDASPVSLRGSTTTESDLAVRLSELARSLEHEPDVEDTLQAIVRAAVTTVPRAEHASISSIVRRREVVTRAFSDDLARLVDRAQYETSQGPCLDTLYEQHTTNIVEMRAERRWPEFARRAADLGIGSMMAVQLYVEDEDLGALNLLSSAAGAFGEEAEHAALLFASHAAVAMVEAQRQRHLRRTIEFRDLIGQAKGILMERYTIDADQAFSLLVRVSQTNNRKLRDVAQEIIDVRFLSPLIPRPPRPRNSP